MWKHLFCNSSSLRVSLLFISLMFLLPCINIYHELPIISFYSEWIAGILGLAAISPWLTAAPQTELRIPQTSLVFLGLGFIVCLQWIQGLLHSTQYALLVISYLIWAFLLTLLGNRLRHKLGWHRFVSSLALFMVIAGIINGGITALQIITRTGGSIAFLPYLPAYGPFAQENHFADFTALTIVSLIYLHAKRRFSTTFTVLLLTWFLFMLAISGSRSAWLYLLATVILALVLQKISNKASRNATARRNLLHICLATLPAFVLIHVFTNYIAPDGLFNLSTDRIVNGVNMDTPSARLNIWYDSLRLFWQSPWLGIGAGKMIPASFLLLDNPTHMAFQGMFEHAHNLFLHLLTEMGIGALLIVLTSLAIWIRQFKWGEFNLERWWLTSLLVILGIHSMLEYPLWYAYFLGITAVLLGAGDEKIITINVKRISNRLIAGLTRGGLAIVILLGSLNLGTMLIGHLKLANAIHQSANNDTNKEALDWVYRYTLLAPYAELMQAIYLVIDHNDIDRQILLNQSALSFRPFSKIAYQQVVLLKLKGDHLNAKKQLKRTLMIYPANLKSALQSMPAQYHQAFLQTLAEIDPVLSKQMAAQE